MIEVRSDIYNYELDIMFIIQVCDVSDVDYHVLYFVMQSFMTHDVMWNYVNGMNGFWISDRRGYLS